MTEKIVLEKTNEFILETCSNRISFHNHDHMIKVANNSVWIIDIMLGFIFTTIYLISIILMYHHVKSSIYVFLVIMMSCIKLNDIVVKIIHPNSLIFIVTIVSLLHDVDKYGTKTIHVKLLKHLDFITKKNLLIDTPYSHLYNTKMILAIIERVSFSRQVKYHTQDWTEILGFYGTIVRHIISDANKLESIGKNGIERCKQCSIEILKKKELTVTDTNIKIEVKNHYLDKLQYIASIRYMKTPVGFVYSLYLNHQMKHCLEF